MAKGIFNHDSPASLLRFSKEEDLSFRGGELHPMVQVSPDSLLPTPQPGFGLAHVCVYELNKHLRTSSSRVKQQAFDKTVRCSASRTSQFCGCLHPPFLPSFFFFFTKSLCVFIYFIEDFIAVAGKLSGLVFKIFL